LPIVEEFRQKGKLSIDFYSQPISVKLPLLLPKFITQGFQIEFGFKYTKKFAGFENSHARFGKTSNFISTWH